MELNKMIAELQEERIRIDQALVTLQTLAAGRGRRRGRPPAWLSQTKRVGRPKGSKNSKAVAAAV